MNELMPMPMAETVYEQVCSHYLDLLNEKGKPPRLADVVARVCEAHSEYSEKETLALVKLPEFDKMLAERRKRHLIDKAAVTLYASERTSKQLPKVMDRIEAMIADSGADIKLKELTDFLKFCVDMDSKVSRSIEDATGTADVTVTLNIKNLLIGLPPERRAMVMSRMLQEGVVDVEAEDG